MKIYLIALTLVLSVSAMASEVLPFEAICDDTDTIFKKLLSKYEEKPIVIGISADRIGSTMTLWANSKTQSWTIVATKGELSCVIGTGSKVTLILGESI
jgi:hypothetical protein